MVSSHGYEGDRDKVYSTSGRGETLGEVMARRLGRRSLLKGAAGAWVWRHLR